MPAVGIDYGTSNSAAATIVAGMPRPFLLGSNGSTMPSVACYSANGECIGAAIRAAVLRKGFYQANLVDATLFGSEARELMFSVATMTPAPH